MRSCTMAALGAAALVTGACATAPPPTQELTDAKAAVSAAEEVRIDDPEAAYHIKLAREQIALAEQLIEDGRMQGAREALERAAADAQVALALSRETQARQRAQAALDDVDRVRRGL